jgi:hypothetical protein
MLGNTLLCDSSAQRLQMSTMVFARGCLSLVQFVHLTVLCRRREELQQ